jgi:hypothetical protein
MKTIKISSSFVSIILLALCVALIHVSNKNWKKQPGVINGDVISYYAYLPATFIFNDIKLEKNKSFEHGTFWPEKTPDGRNVIKTTMGLSYLYAPFFGIAHAYALLSGQDAWGFSAPYQIALLISSIFFLILGLIFLRRVLLRFFSEKICFLTILAIVSGTNLAYYISYDAAVSHGFIFSISCLFLWLTVRWHDHPDSKTSLFIGLIGGLLTLIRPTNILILIYFALFAIQNTSDIRNKFNIITRKPWLLFLMIGGFLIPWIPQFVYWKITTGHIMFYSYTSNETFLYSSPKIYQILLGFRKGWLIYTPIMIFGIAGIFFLRNKLKQFLIPTIVLFFTFTYLVSCWWCWWFGGSYGMRPMIDIYAYLTIPLAAFFSYILTKTNWIRHTGLIIVVGLIAHNIFQINQYLHGSINYAFMTQKAYCISFGHLRPQPGFYEALEEPDPEPAKLNIQSILIHIAESPVKLDSNRIVSRFYDQIKPEYSDFKNDPQSISSEQAFSGMNSIKLDLKHPVGFELQIRKEQLRKQILVRVKKYGNTGRLVIRAQKENEFCVSSGDSWPITGSKWEQQEFLINTPKLKKSDYLSFFCCNPVNRLQYYDEMEVFILN